MPEPVLDLPELMRILREVGGAAEHVDPEDDVMDTPFADLGYDSLAIMEAAARIGQEYGVRLDDDAVFEASNPRRLLDAVKRVGSRS